MPYEKLNSWRNILFNFKNKLLLINKYILILNIKHYCQLKDELIFFFFLKEEEAMLSEMEVTGQAFEDMQEQNSRLIQQLREKDDANFKLMTERIKSNQLHKLAREETDTLKELVSFKLFHRIYV